MRRKLLQAVIVVLLPFSITAVYFAAVRPVQCRVLPVYASTVTQWDDWRRQSAPILVPSLAWEKHAVQEPSVLFDGDTWHMWYTGGWDATAIGYAKSADGLTWSKHVDPVMGLGYGGFAGSAARPTIFKDNGGYYLFFADTGTTGYGMALYVAASVDGVAFDAPRRVLAPGNVDFGLANSAVWREGDTLYMLYESRLTNDLWGIFLAKGSSVYDWQKVGAVDGLAFGGMAGGVYVQRSGALYHAWYHASRSGHVPTDIYHATSTDLLHWRRVNDAPVVARQAGEDIDQIADPSIAGGRLYYDMVNNDSVRSAIGVAAGHRDIAAALRGVAGYLVNSKYCALPK